LGIKVANIPLFPYSVAEHAAALLMALNRKIVLGQNLNMGTIADHLIGFDLHGKKSRDYWHWKIGVLF
jgi:D-lactate dehydrogenase